MAEDMASIARDITVAVLEANTMALTGDEHIAFAKKAYKEVFKTVRACYQGNPDKED